MAKIWLNVPPVYAAILLLIFIHSSITCAQNVKQGELLFETDEQPYQYALEKAISDQATLEGKSKTSGTESPHR
jgi:hypothetical protein